MRHSSRSAANPMGLAARPTRDPSLPILTAMAYNTSQPGPNLKGPVILTSGEQTEPSIADRAGEHDMSSNNEEAPDT